MLKGLFLPKINRQNDLSKQHIIEMGIIEKFYKEGPVDIIKNIHDWDEALQIILEWHAFRNLGVYDYAKSKSKA